MRLTGPYFLGIKNSTKLRSTCRTSMKTMHTSWEREKEREMDANQAWFGGVGDPDARPRRWRRRLGAFYEEAKSRCEPKCRCRKGFPPSAWGTPHRRAPPCTWPENRWPGRWGCRPCRKRRLLGAFWVREDERTFAWRS